VSEGELTNTLNEAGAASEGGWGPREEGQQTGGRGMGGCAERSGMRQREMEESTRLMTLWLLRGAQMSR